jgi:Protein of unknown function (DUF3990)
MAKVPSWTNSDIKLYHGTTGTSAVSILAGITTGSGRSRTDFGQGFYTTTSEQQARDWANKQAATYNTRNPTLLPETAAVVEFIIERDALAALESIWFVRGDAGADDYWNLIQHFRIGSSVGKDHQRTAPNNWYDIAIGPLAASWTPTRRALKDTDQISFHTHRAVALLNGLQAHKKSQVP